MEFTFSEDQLLRRQLLREYLGSACTPVRVRDAWASATGIPSDLWTGLAEIGVLGVLAPEWAGGMGMDDVDMVGLLEETGRVALPGPVVEHAATAVPLLEVVGDPAGWLREAVEGRVVLTCGPVDGIVSHADVADVVIVGSDQAITALEPRDQGRDAFARLPSVDGARRPVRVGSADGLILATGDRARAVWADAFDRAALGVAAQLCGLAERMLEMTVAYAKERRQFGSPIGAYQAVKHQLANAFVKLEFARPVVHRAAYSLARSDPQRSVHVSMAKAYATDAARYTARVALQCHGAIGYTTEYDLHLFMKRTWALAAAWGDPGFHRRRVARAVLGPSPQGS
jgi:alkylation response protein AidB-like acyl-CoA dehydrogenase